MFKNFVINDESVEDEEINELLRKKEKWICYARLSLWTYKKDFIHAFIYLMICIILLFFIHDHTIMRLAGDGVSGFQPEYRYHYISWLAEHWDVWYIHMLKVLPLWLSWGCIKNALIQFVSFRLILTNKRVMIVDGVVAKDYDDMPLEKIETIRVLQDFTGKMFKYGDVVIKGVGDTKYYIGGIAEPLLLKKQIDHYQHAIEDDEDKEKDE